MSPPTPPYPKEKSWQRPCPMHINKLNVPAFTTWSVQHAGDLLCHFRKYCTLLRRLFLKTTSYLLYLLLVSFSNYISVSLVRVVHLLVSSSDVRIA